MITNNVNVFNIVQKYETPAVFTNRSFYVQYELFVSMLDYLPVAPVAQR